MSLQSLRPMLWTDQLSETIAFYTEVLGFAIAESNAEWGWASLYKDKVELMVAKPNAHRPFEKPIFTGSFYFVTDAVDALWLSLKDKVHVVYPLESFEWEMREFAIYDNNGYLRKYPLLS